MRDYYALLSMTDNKQIYKGLGFGLRCFTPFSIYFSYIVAVSFLGGGNPSIRRKPPTCRKSLTNVIT